jgi:hypothetical protein
LLEPTVSSFNCVSEIGYDLSQTLFVRLFSDVVEECHSFVDFGVRSECALSLEDRGIKFVQRGAGPEAECGRCELVIAKIGSPFIEAWP